MSPPKKSYTRETSDFRLIYERLHTLMAKGIESNGFKAEYEAISFVSCLFSHVMEVDFVSNYLNIFVDYHHIKDKDILATKIRFFLGDMIACVSQEAHKLGVSSRYVTMFFREFNAANTSRFASAIANKELDNFDTVDSLMKSCLEELYRYMDGCIVNARLVDSKQFHIESRIPIPVIILIGSTTAVIVTLLTGL